MTHKNLLKKENVTKDKKKKKIPNSNNILKLLYQGKCHYGQSLQKTNPLNYSCLHSVRNNQSILDLGLTTQNILRTFFFIRKIIEKNSYYINKGHSKIIFVSNSKNVKHLNIFKDNKEFGGFLHVINSSWVSQYFTNVFRLKKKKKKIKILAIILLSTDNFEDITKEAKKYNLPIISLIDSDQNSSKIEYPIMSNTENLSSLYTIMTLFKKLLNIRH